MMAPQISFYQLLIYMKILIGNMVDLAMVDERVFLMKSLVFLQSKVSYIYTEN